MFVEEAKQRALHLLVEYERAGDPQTLRQAVAAYRQLHRAIPGDDSDRAACLANLGIALLRSFELTDDVTLLQEAAGVCQDAASITPPEHPEFLGLQFNASQLLSQLFEQTGNRASLPDAAQAARNALRAVRPDSLDRADMLTALGDTLQMAFEWLGELSDLKLAVGAFRAALDDLPAGSRPHVGCQARLCVALRLVYERTDDLDALRDAIVMGRSAVADTPVDNPNFARFRGNLGNALRASYVRTADVEVLGEALEIAREMVDAFPVGHDDRAIALNVLAISLRLEYERTGDLPILRQAVEAGRDAIGALQPPFLHRVTYTMNLAVDVRMLAERTHDRELAREAVGLARAAIEGFALDDPERVKGQSILSQTLLTLGDLDDDTDTLLEGLGVADDVRDAMPYDHPWYVVQLMNYTRALMELYYRKKVPQFLDRALRAASNAVASTSTDDALSTKVLANLGLVIEAAAEADVTGLDLAQAERVIRDALRAVSPNHSERADLLSKLGDLLARKVRQTGDLTTARECVSAYSLAARMPSGSPRLRVQAAHRAARAALLVGHHNKAIEMAETAVELVPQMIARDVGRADRERRLRGLYGLASTVAAAAVSVGRHDRAVELLEQARGLILASTLETRSDLTELAVFAPDLAGPFEELRQALNALDHESVVVGNNLPTPELGARLRELTATREHLNQEWDRLLDRIRQRDRLQAFLRPPRIEDLRKQAANGPIVYVTVGDQHGYALIVQGEPGSQVQALRLPADLTAPTLQAKVFEFRDARDVAADKSLPARERRAAQLRILDILSWTWENITEPVLRHLGHTAAAPEQGPWPRIWWCPVGLVTFLPLHAAGCHTGSDSVMDRVISSYTPSIRALTYTRERPSATLTSALVVAVQDAPESPPLGSALLEAEIVRTFVPDAEVLPPPGAESDHDSVLEALRRHGIAHLACHGVADWRNPSDSRLILHDHLTHPLTLHDITVLHLESAQLAYLSACSTADTHALQADESTHLAGAFQLAGYRNVIGTLWPISEEVATAVAHDVYAALTSDGTTRPALDRVAEALHQATRNQRDRTPALPTRWAAYIHYGA